MNTITRGQKIYFAAVGLLALWVGIWGYFIPSQVDKAIPWQLTPLTARSLSGWLIAIGTLMLTLSLEDDWTRARLATPMLILGLPVLLLQMFRYADQVDWGNTILWIALILFAVISFCGLYLANGNWRNALS